MRHPHPIKIALVSLVAATLVSGCGGGGGGSSAGTTAPVAFEGTAAKGLIAGGKVEVFEVVNGQVSSTAKQIYAKDATTGACGTTLVAKVDTDTVASGTPGEFRFCLPSTSNPVVVKVSQQAGAQVQDEITGNFEAMDANLSMRTFAENGTAPKSVSVNPFTELTISKVPAGALAPSVIAQVVQSSVSKMTNGVDPFLIRPSGTELGPQAIALKAALATVAQFANEQATANGCNAGEDKFVCAIRTLADASPMKVEADGTVKLKTASELNGGVAGRFKAAFDKLEGGTVTASVGGAALTAPLAAAKADASNPFANFTSVDDMLSKTSVVSTADAEKIRSVETYAQNLLAASKAFKKYAESFESKVQTIQNTGVDSVQMVEFVGQALSTLCNYSKSTQSFTCTTGSEVPFANSSFPNKDIDLYHAGGQGYKLSLAGTADSYTYTITNGTKSFTGEAKFTKPSGGGLLTLKGTYPSIFGPARDQVREATADIAFSASVLSKDGLTDGQTVTGAASASVVTAASTSPAVGAMSVSITGTLTMTYHKASDELEVVSFSNGTLNYSIGGDKFVGTLSGTGKTYAVSSTNTKRQNELETMTTTGTLTLSQGDVLQGTFTLNLDHSAVDFGANPSASNYAKGSATASVQLYDKDRTNFGKIDATLSRVKATERSAAVTWQVGEGSAAYWVKFAETQSLSPSEVNKDYFTVDADGETKVLLKITSSGGYTADYNQDTKTTPNGIKNSAGVVVGSITSQYQLLIDGRVVAMGFDL